MTRKILFILLILSGITHAEIINVPDDFETIQAAIDTSQDGDTVLVSPGTYVENINYNGKIITVASLMLTTGDEVYIDSTVIDGDANGHSVVVFRSGESEDALFTGFTITNGRTDYGGGIYITAVDNQGTNPTLTNLVVKDNYVSENGGGIHITREASALIDNVIIEHNSARDGGGLAVFWEAHLTISNSLIVDNIGRSEGGGTKFAYLAEVMMQNCQVINNWSPMSAGIFCEESASLTFETGVISGNYNEDSGAIALRASQSTVNLSHILISENTTEEESYTIRLEGCDAVFENLSIVGNPDNTLAGIYASSTNFSILNCIIRDHDSYEVESTSRSTIISYCDIEDGENGVNCRYIEWGEGNIDEDPQFFNPEDGDYHLTLNSPCIDAGDPDSPLDPDSTRADMGALYFDQRSFVAEGFVLDADDDSPLVNASVITSFRDTTYTDTSGFWRIPRVHEMPFDITALAEGYIDTTYYNLQFEPDDTLRVTFRLGHPEFLLSRDEIILELNQGDSAQFDIELDNNGNRCLEYSVTKHIPGMNPWSLMNRIELSNEGEYRYYGVVLVEDSLLYISAHTPDGNKIFVTNEDGELLNEFSQPGESNYGFYDLAWDGELVWGIDGQAVYSFDLNGEFRWNWDLQEERLSMITWDYKREILWIAGITRRSISGYSIDGNLISEIDLNEFRPYLYGLSYNGDDPDGYGLYVQHRDSDNRCSQIYKINTFSNDILFVKTLYNDEDGRCRGGFISDSYIPNASTFISVFYVQDSFFIDIWLIDAYKDWMDLNPMCGFIETGQSQDFELTIRTANITPGEFNGNLIFQHNALGGADTLSVLLQNSTSVRQESTITPDKFDITNIYPNPFNAVTRLSYDIAMNGRVNICVFDITGRLIYTLVNDELKAGSHETFWDAGKQASGIYLIRMQAGSYTLVRKMVLVR